MLKCSLRVARGAQLPKYFESPEIIFRPCNESLNLNWDIVRISYVNLMMFLHFGTTYPVQISKLITVPGRDGWGPEIWQWGTTGILGGASSEVQVDSIQPFQWSERRRFRKLNTFLHTSQSTSPAMLHIRVLICGKARQHATRTEMLIVDAYCHPGIPLES